MPRRISVAEYRTRQMLLRHAVPFLVSGFGKMARVAETRVRRTVAISRYVRGSGIEVGAGVSPAVVPPGCTVRYVDKYDTEALDQTPEFHGYPIPRPDILDDAETLATISNQSQDFAIAFSLFEHLQDPIRALANFHRVTREGGAIVLTVPDKRYYEPDMPRPLTPFAHLVADHEGGPEASRRDHFREFGAARGLTGDALEDFVKQHLDEDAHVHFHVWDADSFLEFVISTRRYLGTHFSLVEFGSYGHEALVALKVHH